MLNFLETRLIIESVFISHEGGTYFQKNGIVELDIHDYE